MKSCPSNQRFQDENNKLIEALKEEEISCRSRKYKSKYKIVVTKRKGNVMVF